MALSHLLLRRLHYSKLISLLPLSHSSTKSMVGFSSLPSSTTDSAHNFSPTQKPTSLSARMSFIFDKIDEIDKQRDEKHETLQRIRSWRQSKNEPFTESPVSEGLETELEKSESLMEKSNVKKEAEVVHPWPEWIELMERLVLQNYFDHKRKDEDGMMEGLGLDKSDAAAVEMDEKELHVVRDFRAVQAAMVNFGRDRFDILRSLSHHDIQILVGYGCPSAEKKVAFSGKLLRKHVHLDEGDVCSSCNLRSTCEKAYLLTNKEDEPQTIDVIRVLLAYGFDPIDGTVTNKSLLKMKSVKTVVRKLLHEVVKLSAVPIDPNLSRPVIKKPPPKVKIPPPPPKKRVGRNDIEMKKGDWLCPKCDFMNFAKNTVCMQCDAKRPKRELLPGEWECPQCNFLNYRRNTVCFHCEHNRPPDTYAPNHFSENQHNPRTRNEKTFDRTGVSNAWNFDFDDNESDGADVAAFEYADSHKQDGDFSLGNQNFGENSRREYSDSIPVRPGTGFNDDFDEDEDDIDSYEVVSQNEVSKTPRINLSELETDSESEDMENTSDKRNVNRKTDSPTRDKKPLHRKPYSDFDDDDLPVHPNWKSSHVADQKSQRRSRGSMTFGSDDDELGSSSGSDGGDIKSRNNKGNRRGSNRMDRGGRSRSVSRISDSDDDFSYNNRSNRGGRNDRRKASIGRGGFNKRNSRGDEDDFDDRPARRGGLKYRSDRQGESFDKRGGSSDRGRGLFDKRGGSSDKRGGSSARGRGSFDKRGGRLSRSDNRSESFPDDERQMRPRNNVR